MITLRKSNDRGHAEHGWLDSHHTFSFAGYYDPAHMGLRTLRVINEDRVQPGKGFGTHPHRDMEIISVVLDGSLEHQDSLGNGSVIRPGDIQRMSAGTGVLHSEFNPSDADQVHFLQIWIQPEAQGAEPGYEQKHFPPAERRNTLLLVASRDGRAGSLTVHQDADLYVSTLEPSQGVEHTLAPGRVAWVQVTRGAVRVNGQPLEVGDGAAITDEDRVQITADDDAELLLFDLV